MMTAMKMGQQKGLTPRKARQSAGMLGYLAGHAAEEFVAGAYAKQGHDIVARRWRGSAGEIDLIASDGTGFVFVEVKKSKSMSAAAMRLSRKQIDRI
jgi:putative endonuclease